MSNTSIQDLIKAHVDSKELFQIEPIFFNYQPQRGLFVSKEVFKFLNKLTEGKEETERMAFIKASLNTFVEGDYIDNNHYMKRLHKKPRDVWTIRILQTPGYRIFGVFSHYNTFICTHVVLRNNLNREGKIWESEMEKVISFWKNLFPGHNLFTSDNFNNYVSNGGHHDW